MRSFVRTRGGKNHAEKKGIGTSVTGPCGKKSTKFRSGLEAPRPSLQPCPGMEKTKNEGGWIGSKTKKRSSGKPSKGGQGNPTG